MSYLIWSFEHDAWWRPNRAGYTESVDEAGRYSKADAGDIVTDSIGNAEVAIYEPLAQQRGAPSFHPYVGKERQHTFR